MRQARRRNTRTYAEVTCSGLARLLALDCETYGRWGLDPLWLVPALARERSRGLPARVRRGLQLRVAARWWSILSVAAQRLVAQACMLLVGDLTSGVGEHAPLPADLPSLP